MGLVGMMLLWICADYYNEKIEFLETMA